MTQTIAPEQSWAPMLPHPYRVVGTVVETQDTVTLLFESLSDHQLRFRPGQFTMLYVYGVGEVPISIAGNPHLGGQLVHTVRAVGAVTRAICGLRAGDVVGIRGPFGTGWPIDQVAGRDLLIVAGGIGLAPLRPAVIEALTQRESIRQLSLLYGARTPNDLLYKDDLIGWKASPSIDFEVTVDRAHSDWWGDVGLVTNLLPRVRFQPDRTTAFVCGPEVMMRVVARALRTAGVHEDRVFVSLERNMKCGIGMCGHCQYGSDLLCRTGPVAPYSAVADRLKVDEL